MAFCIVANQDSEEDYVRITNGCPCMANNSERQRFDDPEEAQTLADEFNDPENEHYSDDVMYHVEEDDDSLPPPRG